MTGKTFIPRILVTVSGLLLIAICLCIGSITISTLIGLMLGVILSIIGVLANKKHAVTGLLMLVIGITSLILGLMLLVFNMLATGYMMQTENIIAATISFAGVLTAISSRYYFEHNSSTRDLITG